MDIKEAVNKDIKESSFNKGNLSFLMYGSSDTLRHKIDGYKGRNLTHEDVMRVMELTGGRNIIKSMAQNFGGLYVPLPDQPEFLENQDLMTESQKVNVALGDFFAKFQEISNDGEITQEEKQQLIDKGFDVCSQLFAFCKGAEYLYCRK